MKDHLELEKIRRKALNPAVIKVTPAEKLKQIKLGEYFQWLQDSEQMIRLLKKGKLSPWRADGIEKGHQRAVQLGYFKHGKK